MSEHTSTDVPADRPAAATGAAVRDLLAAVAGLEAQILAGDKALPDETALLEGYRWMFAILQVGVDAFVTADSSRPRFTEIVGPAKKWGGDNSDAFYQYAPIDPTRTYRVRGLKGDAVYFSLTVYGGPDDGHYSERIVTSINMTDLTIGDDGFFEFVLSPQEHIAVPWLKLEPDAVCVITRDYLEQPGSGRRLEWQIDAIDGHDDGWRLTDADQARRFRAAATWVRDQAAIVPVVLADPNTVAEPYPVPTTTFGWAAGDASYAMGSFELAEDEALVVEGRSPDCAFWNCCLWNELLHTFNYDYEVEGAAGTSRVTINGAQTTYEPDGSWRLVISERDPGVPNWLWTQGHTHGLIWFRWFLPDVTPDRPTTRVVKVAEVAGL
ncbi:MAG: DUF1214 domain-containing protein [Acidimicrobiales bacterium]